MVGMNPNLPSLSFGRKGELMKLFAYAAEQTGHVVCSEDVFAALCVVAKVENRGIELEFKSGGESWTAHRVANLERGTMEPVDPENLRGREIPELPEVDDPAGDEDSGEVL